MDEDKRTADPMDGSQSELSPSELARVRAATKWVEDAKPMINPVVVIAANWKAWAVGFAVLAIARRPEIVAVIELFGGTP